MSTLKEALGLLGAPIIKAKRNIAAELLGKYRGILSKGKTAGSFIKSQRASLYGKIK